LACACYLGSKNNMKKYIIFIFCTFLLACGQGTQNAEQGADSSQQVAAMFTDSSSGGGNPFIPLDTANMMIKSYLNSINYTQNDTLLHSVIVDANALRSYLSSAAAGVSGKVKISFAHTLDYINNGGANQYCGMQSGKLTLILSAVNDAGNYVYFNGTSVMDRGVPCPHHCPVEGTAARDTFPVSQ
jgi:hypothetical protein